MRSNKLVSIIVPVYNVEDYLKRCIDSILVQTYPNIEIVLINDGSTDSSPEICQFYSDKYKNIVLINKENGGLSMARNDGIKASKGYYVYFLDSDDSIDDDTIEYLVNLIEKSGADIATGCVRDIIKDRTVESTKANEKYEIKEKIYKGDNILFEWMGGSDITGYMAAKLIKRKLIKDIEFPAGRIYEDTFFNQKLFRRIRIVVTSTKKLHNYFRGRLGSISNAFYSPKNLDIIEAYRLNIEYIRENKPHLLEAAYSRLYWSIGIVIDKMALINNYEELEDFKILYKYLTNNRKKIFANKYLSNNRKRQFRFMIFSRRLYSIFIKAVVRYRGYLQ